MVSDPFLKEPLQVFDAEVDIVQYSPERALGDLAAWMNRHSGSPAVEMAENINDCQ